MPKKLPFWDHVEELRKALIRSGWSILITTLAAFYFHKEIFKLIVAPLNTHKFYLLSPLEGFCSASKIAFWTGMIFSSPVWIYSLVSFLAPALKGFEKKILIPFLVTSFFFILGGILFAYFITIPLALKFFEGFNTALGENLWSLSSALDLIVSLFLAHGLIFELYVILLFLIYFDLCPYALLKKVRRGVIVAIFILSAILTPPDVLSQLLLAFPMLILFESALLFARFRKSS